MIHTPQDVLRALTAYTGSDARLIASIDALLSEPPERQAPILTAIRDLSNGIPNMGVILACETIVSIGQMLAQEE